MRTTRVLVTLAVWIVAGCRTPSPEPAAEREAPATLDAKLRAAEALAADDPELAARQLAAITGEAVVAEKTMAAVAEASTAALATVLAEVSTATRIQVAETLFDLVEKSAPEVPRSLATLLVGMSSTTPDVLGFFARALDRPGQEARKIAASAVVRAWEMHRAAAEELLADISPERLLALLIPCHLPRQGRHALRGESIPDPSFNAGIDMAAWVVAHHREPEVRAVALSFQVFRSRTGRLVEYDLAPVVRAWTNDPSPLVRTTALRITGYLGDQPEGLDLTEVLLGEEDPAFLAAAIEARTLWTSDRADGLSGFELWDGFACNWVPEGDVTRAWRAEEIARLRALLEARREPELRDACSLALASRYRDLERTPEDAAPQPIRMPGLKVHEWGVWGDAGGVLLPPPEEVLADLPGFVHRATVPLEGIAEQRFVTPVVVFKPVVFFHAPEPVSLLVRVGFHRGRPWTYYPAATDYIDELEEETPWGASLDSPLTPLPERERVAPPWARAAAAASAAAAAAPESERSYSAPAWTWSRRYPDPRAASPTVLHPFYDRVPWLVPNHPLSLTEGGPHVFSSLGLEWCGLRVGYPVELEAPRPEVDRRSWWAHLRDVPCQDVAVRGERERFLFYDGAVDFPAPVSTSWSDERRRELVVRVRRFEEFPLSPTPEEVSERWWLSARERSRVRVPVPIPAVFVVAAEPGRETRGTVLERLLPAGDPLRLPLAELDLGAAELRRRLLEVLVREGLGGEEARALLATWEKEFFAAPGRRIVTVLPRWMYDALLPLEVFPVPEELVRVGLVWKELE